MIDTPDTLSSLAGHVQKADHRIRAMKDESLTQYHQQTQDRHVEMQREAARPVGAGHAQNVQQRADRPRKRLLVGKARPLPLRLGR